MTISLVYTKDQKCCILKMTAYSHTVINTTLLHTLCQLLKISCGNTLEPLAVTFLSYRARLSTGGHQAFSVAGPMAWNSLPDNLQDIDIGTDSFRRSLKTFLFSTY